MKKLFKFFFSIAAISILLTSCEKPAPIAEIFFEASATDAYVINFSAQVENVTSYSWDFDDGETSVEVAPVHTYASSGDYTVSLTVSGEGGDLTVTKAVSILPSMSELLSGGPEATGGRTWKLSTSVTAGLDGAGVVGAAFPTTIMPGTDNMLTQIGLGDEYDNEFTFYHDGTMDIDTKNGNCIAGYMYSVMKGLTANIVTPFGVVQAEVANITGAGWALTEATDLVVESINEILEVPETITFTEADYLTFTDDGFIGILGFTPRVIVRQLTTDRMVLACFLHGNLEDATKPTNIITFSLDVVE